jgi:hypothetical protein
MQILKKELCRVLDFDYVDSMLKQKMMKPLIRNHKRREINRSVLKENHSRARIAAREKAFWS